MSQLCAQSIRELCSGEFPMIYPFSDEKVVINGKSYGLSAASYDMRINHDLTLGAHPAHLLLDLLQSGEDPNLVLHLMQEKLPSPNFSLAYTIEDLIIPANVAAQVVDKSTYARMHVSAFNTFIDPGFRGNLTLELVNHSDRPVFIRAGDPICQLVFYWLDMPTDRPYRGQVPEPAARGRRGHPGGTGRGSAMKAIADYVARLRATSGALEATEADVIREVQVDAFQAGYAQAARELFGIALESQKRMDVLLARTVEPGVVVKRAVAN